MFNNFNNNGMPMGSFYGQNKMVAPQNTQPLTQAEQNELKKKSPTFTTELTREELLRSYCTHRNKDGSALSPNPDGSATCTICGEVVAFPPEGYTKEEVQEIVMKFDNLLNVIKCEYFDIPPQIVKDFFQIIPYVKRVPALYNLAMQNFNSYSNKNIPGTNPVYGADAYNFWNTFDMFHGAGNGMVMNGGMMGQNNGMMMNGQQQPNMMMGGNGGMTMQGNPFFANGVAQQGQVMDMNTINTGAGMNMGASTGQQVAQNNQNQNTQQQNPTDSQSPMATTTTQVQL